MAKGRTNAEDKGVGTSAAADQPTGQVLVKLNHICHKPGCEGRDGDVISVSEEDAAYLIGRGGAARCDAAGNVVKSSGKKVAHGDVSKDDSAGDPE